MSLDDKAADAEEFFRDLALRRQQQTAKQLMATGFCHYCGSPVQPGILFCPAEFGEDDCCRDDYERDQRARERNGN